MLALDVFNVSVFLPPESAKSLNVFWHIYNESKVIIIIIIYIENKNISVSK